MATCRSCHAPVEWVCTTQGRRMPIDPEPVEGGNLVKAGTVLWAGEEIPRVVYDQPLPEGTLDLTREGREPARYVSHFATCPNADEHRRE